MSDIIKIYANELFYISYYTFEFILKENKKKLKFLQKSNLLIYFSQKLKILNSFLLIFK